MGLAELTRNAVHVLPAGALEAVFSALVMTADLPFYCIRHRESRTGFEAP